MKIKTRANLIGLIWAFNFAVLATMGSAILEKNAEPRWVIGVHGAVYYLSAGVAAVAAPGLFKILPMRVCLLLGIVGSSIPALLFPFFESHWVWFGLRIIHGVSAALVLVPLELLVFQSCAGGEKAKGFGVFELALALGAGIGASVSPLLEEWGSGLSFLISGSLSLVTVICIPKIQTLLVDQNQEVHLSLREFLKLGFCYGTAFSQGFLEGGLMAYLGVVLLDQGFNDHGVSLVFAAMFGGIIASMLLVTRLADRMGLMKVLGISHLVSGLALVWVWLDTSFPAWSCGMFLVGLAVGCQYAIALVVIGEVLPIQKQPGGNSLYLAINCAGSVSGPLVLAASQMAYSSGIMPLMAGIPVAVLLICRTITRFAETGWKRNEK